MAQKVEVLLTCDLHDDETEAAETVSFGFDGSSYAFELCQEHLDDFSEVMQGYIGAARRAETAGRRRSGRQPAPSAAGSGAPRPVRANKEDLQTIREWARSNGYQVSDRGRISGAVRKAFEAAQA